MGTQNQSIEYKTRVCWMFTVLASLFVSMLHHCGVPVHLYCIDDGAPGHQDIPGPYWGVCVTVATSALQSKQRLGRSALAPAAVCFAHLLIWKYRKKSGLTGTPARKLFPTSPRHCALVISASHYAPDCGQCWYSLHGVTENDHEWANWWDLLKVYIFWMYSQLQCGDHLWIHIQGANLQSDSVLGRKFAVPRPQKIGTSNWVWVETYYYHIWWNKHPLTSRFRVPRVLTAQIHDADWLMKLSTVLLCAWHCSPGSLLCLRLFCTLKNVFDTVVDFSRVLGTVLHCSLLCSRLFSLLCLTLFRSHLRERQSHTLRHTLPEYVL